MRLRGGTPCEVEPSAYDEPMANGLTYTRITSTSEATKQLASTLAPYLHAGDVVVLDGDLGAERPSSCKGWLPRSVCGRQ